MRKRHHEERRPKSQTRDFTQLSVMREHSVRSPTAVSFDILRGAVEKKECDRTPCTKPMSGKSGGVERRITQIKTEALCCSGRGEWSLEDFPVRTSIDRAKEETIDDVYGVLFTMANVRIDGLNRTELGILRDERNHDKVAIRLPNGLTNCVVEEERTTLQTRHFLSDGVAEVTSAIPREPLDDEKSEITLKNEAIWQERLS